MDWLILLVVVPFVFGFVGGIVKSTVLGPKPWDYGRFNWFQKGYYKSIAWHPVFTGVGAGAIAWALQGPLPEVFGTSLVGYLTAGLFAGGVSIVGYALIVKTIRRMIGAAGALVGGAGSGNARREDDDP